MRGRRKFSVEFKKKVIEDIKLGLVTMGQACREHEVSQSVIYRWRDQYEHGRLNNEPTETGALENKIAKLERKVGQQAMEIDLLKKAREYYARSLREKSSGAARKEASENGAKS